MLNNLINVDLHIHSVASSYKERAGLVTDCDSAHCDVLLDKLLDPANNISLFSITDHNRFSTEIYDAFYKRIEERQLDVFLIPGVEFDVLFDESKPDVHVITIFDARTQDDRTKIEEAIKGDMLHGESDSYDLTRYGRLLCNINLPTILIAHQHNGLGAGNHRDRSMTAGTDEAMDYYKFGYIDALEFSTPKVEAILRSELRDLQLPPSMLAGSDCHDWSVYPKQTPESATPNAFSMRLRALPTFKGLLLALTSPNTRVGTREYGIWENCLTSIEICGETIPLSPGLNAIIGENGVGKSSLLKLVREHRGSRKQHVKDVQKLFRVKVERSLREDDCIFIEQGHLQKNYQDGKVFDENLFLEVNHTAFDDAVKQYSKMLQERVRSNIEREKAIAKYFQVSFAVDPEKEEGQTHYVRVKVDEGFADVANPYVEPHNELHGVTRKLSMETKREGVYKSEEITKLRKAKKLVEEVARSIDARLLDKQAEGKARSRIQEEFEGYEDVVTEKSSTQDNDITAYKSERSNFISAVTELAALFVQAVPSTVEKIELVSEWGISRNITGGFNFVMAAEYANSADVTADFLKSMFNAEYQTQERIEEISDEATALSALTGATSGDWQTAWSTNLSKFLVNAKRCKPSILDLDDNGIGDTLGEEALTFYKYKTSTLSRDGEHKVFIVDQPEDNISNARISIDLIKHFNHLRGNAQVLMVTHNPLLVVNQDVDNVIVLSKEDGIPQVIAGCLESESEDGETILDLVARIMDGGRDAIRRRLKAYGQEDSGDRRRR